MCGISVKPIKHSSSSLIQYRGPDKTNLLEINDYLFTFHRLAIMDTSESGNQPFEDNNWILVCNGEIFNYEELKQKYSDYNYISYSDCEVIVPMLNIHLLSELCNCLDGEFAFVAYDKKFKRVIAARDPMGIRPLFYGYTSDRQIAFASEMKELMNCCNYIYPVLPGYIYDGFEFKPYCELWRLSGGKNYLESSILTNIRNILTSSIVKRLHADVNIGFLLSGGLDSSLVCAIAQKYLNKPITTFAIGFYKEAIDLKYAKIVANYIGSNHHEVLFNEEDIEQILQTIIWHTETWDVTTIRASIPMFLLCKYIREFTDIRVVMTGEVSDELFGYKYTDFAPNAYEFEKESQKRIKELYMYDVLRADRCISGNSLEARVPFADKRFVEYVMHIEANLKMNRQNLGKYLLRQAFNGTNMLPQEILMRDKAAFSDAVGHLMVDYLKQIAEEKYSDAVFDTLVADYTYNPPFTKEALMYREIFRKLFIDQEHIIEGYWLPNRTWPNCDLIDPSARYLPNYGASAC